MKFIRTKSGKIINLKRYRIVNTHGMPYIQFYDKEKVCDFELSRQEYETAKQADTIEELCDEFVIIDEDGEPNIKQGRDIDHCRRTWAINNCLIYGAIWTTKGLIYVAKMNDEGRLELL